MAEKGVMVVYITVLVPISGWKQVINMSNAISQSWPMGPRFWNLIFKHKALLPQVPFRIKRAKTSQ